MPKKLFSCCIIFLLSLLLTVSTFALEVPLPMSLQMLPTLKA